jgi:hypothetical protein
MVKVDEFTHYNLDVHTVFCSAWFSSYLYQSALNYIMQACTVSRFATAVSHSIT